MKFLTAILITSFFSAITWSGDFNSAINTAAKENKLIIINFSGSDWCGPCIRLRHEILESATFERYAKDNLVLVRADFPREKKNQLDAEQKKRNDALSDKYNPNGVFPYTLVIDKKGKVLKRWDGFPKESPEKFVAEIKTIADAVH